MTMSVFFVLVALSLISGCSSGECWVGAKSGHNYALKSEKCESCAKWTFDSGFEYFECVDGKNCSGTCREERFDQVHTINDEMAAKGWGCNLAKGRGQKCCCNTTFDDYCSYNPPKPYVMCYIYAEMEGEHQFFVTDRTTQEAKSCMVFIFDSGMIFRGPGTLRTEEEICGGDSKVTLSERTYQELWNSYKHLVIIQRQITHKAHIHCCNTNYCNKGVKVGVNIGLVPAALLIVGYVII